jgi:hypothetical protein
MSHVSDPVELLRRLASRPTSAGAEHGTRPSPALSRDPGATATPLYAAPEEGLVRSDPDADLAWARGEITADLRAKAPDPRRKVTSERLPNGTFVHYCQACGGLASWGYEVVPERGWAGRWLCFMHRDIPH